MPALRIREIIDGLNDLGGMTPAHMALITELVAVCLMAGPKPVTERHDSVTERDERVTPLTDAERAKLYRIRKKEEKEARHGRHVTRDDLAIDNNINNSSIQEGGCGGKPKKRSVTQRGTRLPADWQPPENLWAWAITEKVVPESDLRFETAAFKDYWAAQPGQRGVKLDWNATWRVWIRESIRRKKRFAPKKNNVVEFVSSGPKRSWAEIKAEREKSQ